MKNKINNKNKMNKNKTRFFEGYTIAIEQTLPILIISYRKQRTEKKIPQTNGKKNTAALSEQKINTFLSKKKKS